MLIQVNLQKIESNLGAWSSYRMVLATKEDLAKYSHFSP